MGGAAAGPAVDLVLGFGGGKGAQVLVGDKEDFGVLRQGIHHGYGVGGGAADSAQRLHRGRGIYIGHHGVFRVLLEHGPDLGVQSIVKHPAASFHIGQQGDFVRGQDIGGFGHEADAAEHDDVGVGFGGLLGQGKGIPAEIGYFLDFFRLVHVGQNNGVAFFFETGNGIKNIFHD